jgi:hypothetical protein
MARTHKRSQEETLFDFSDIEKDPHTQSIVEEVERIERATNPEVMDVTAKEVASWDFSNLPVEVKAEDEQDLRILGGITDQEKARIDNQVSNGGISERVAQMAMLGVDRMRELRGEDKPKTKAAKLDQPKGLKKAANRLSLNEKAARDRDSVPEHERRDLKPPVFRVQRKSNNTVE